MTIQQAQSLILYSPMIEALGILCYPEAVIIRRKHGELTATMEVRPHGNPHASNMHVLLSDIKFLSEKDKEWMDGKVPSKY